VILRSLVLSQYQRVTDRQTDMSPVAKSRSSPPPAERDKKRVSDNRVAIHLIQFSE